MLQIQYLSVYKGGLSVDTMTVGEFPVYAALIMLFIDCILYLLLTVLCDIAITGRLLAVFPFYRLYINRLWKKTVKNVN